MNTCTVCSSEFTDDEGGVVGNFGMMPVAFCPTCFSCMLDMADQFNTGEEIEQAVLEEREACAKRLDAIGCDHCAENIRLRGRELRGQS